VGEEFSVYVQSIDIEAMGEGVGWSGPGPAPVWLDIAREFTERWVHQQHIRDAVGIPGATEPLFLNPVLATFAMALPFALKDVEADASSTAQLTITGASGGSRTAIKMTEVWQFDVSTDDPTGSVTMDQDTAWRLFTKGISREIGRDASTLTGDPGIAGAPEHGHDPGVIA